MSSLVRTNTEIAEIYNRHSNMVYRICFAYMKNPADTEDAVQNTFCNLLKSWVIFESAEHEKAWLIRTATNVCKNALKHWWRKRENLDDHENIQAAKNSFEIDETFAEVMKLPDKYKSVVYLYYYEGYDSTEIAKILQKPQSTIRYYLSNARKLLCEKLMPGGDLSAE